MVLPNCGSVKYVTQLHHGLEKYVTVPGLGLLQKLCCEL